MTLKVGKSEVQVVTITPEIAKAWLDVNIENNRNLSKRIVDKYARDMNAGQWLFTGDAIRFDKTGKLIDGQHRLAAVEQSGKAIKSLVVYNCDSEVMGVLDTGFARRVRDVLHMNGHSNAANLATTLRLLFIECAYHEGDFSKPTASTQELLSILDINPEIDLYISNSAVIPRGVGVAQISAMYWWIANCAEKRDEAEKFFEVIRSGVPAYEGCPIHSFRERMIKLRGDNDLPIERDRWNTLKWSVNKFLRYEPVIITRVAKKYIPLDGWSSERVLRGSKLSQKRANDVANYHRAKERA